jgi:hypothetical protein
MVPVKGWPSSACVTARSPMLASSTSVGVLLWSCDSARQEVCLP